MSPVFTALNPLARIVSFEALVGDRLHFPLFGLDDVAGPHERERARRARVLGRLGHPLEGLDALARAGVVAELQEAVLAPVARVRHVAGHVAGLPQLLADVEGAHVLVGDLVPHPVLDEDVRRHVDGVRHGRDDLRVDLRGLERQRRVHRIVERVNDVVHRAGVAWVALEHVHGQRAGLDVHARRAVVHRAAALRIDSA